MKTILKQILLIITGVLFIPKAQATVINVSVANFSFTPASFTATVGDTIKWIWVSGTHTTTSTSVPAGAATWDNPITSSSTSFEYIITTPGTYNYWCSIHTTAMEGSFTVTPASVPVISASSKTFASVYPNPANAVLNIHLTAYNANNELVITDILGKEIDKETLKDINTAIDISKWEKGIYFYQLKCNNKTMKGKFEIQ